MAAPVAGVVTQSASQIAQQKVQEQQVKAPKQGESKFDGMMANKAQGAEAAQGVNKAQAPQNVHQTQTVDKAAKADKAQIQRHQPNAPVQNKTMSNLAKMIGDMEKGQTTMDKLIRAGTSGKEFSNGELLSLQAGMYKYTQELELTGKVVEKATSGLKDTLKTQV
jgi:hypothetical protein